MNRLVKILATIFLINFLLFLFFVITNSYPFFAVLINIISVLALGYLITPHTITPPMHKLKRFDSITLVCLFFFALILYLYNIDTITPGIQNDELSIAQASEKILSASQFLPFIPLNLGHPTPLLYLTGLSIKVLGRTLLAIRLPYAFFGALSVASFYVLLRLFFNKSVSTSAALLLLFSYPFIILSRLAYEVTPAIFFEILTGIFLFLAWKRKTLRYFIAVGLTLGLGLYTYLGFRLFAGAAFLLITCIIYKTAAVKKERIKLILITVASFFIVSVPLLSYSVMHVQDIMARTASLSPLNQDFSPMETVTEVAANVGRLSGLFFMGDPTVGPNGDTNFETNPSDVSMFDIGTFIFFLIGLSYIFKYDKKLFFVVILFGIAALANDILVIIKIPEAMHPYGVGHPNTLRIAEIIPVIYFTVAYGLSRMNPSFKMTSEKINFSPVIYIFLAGIIIRNWYIYFQQPTDAPYSYWIDKYNGVYVMNLVNLINKNHITEVGISPTFSSDPRFTYFIKNGVQIKSYNPPNYTDAITLASENQLTIFDPENNKQLALQLLQNQNNTLQIAPLSQPANNPSAGIYALVLIKPQ